MNVKKMFASLTGGLLLAQLAPVAVLGAASYGAELEGAYKYAFEKGITTMASIDSANMYGELTRGQLAKMISNWAEAELGQKADATKVCSFTDESKAEGDLAMYVKKACQMGLMGQGIAEFRPNAKVTRGEFGTTLSRALWGEKYNTTANPYYINHLAALKDAGIMKMIETPNQLEIRGYVMLMLERASLLKPSVDCKDAVISLACKLETSECPAACKKVEETNDVVIKAGDLMVTANGSANGRLFIGRASELDTLALKSSEKISISRVVLERIGYSIKENVKEVRLEDENGARITEPKGLDSKGQVKLTIKKDYRTVNGVLNATIVVDTATSTDALPAKELKPGSTLGFKVVEVESSAKNVNLDTKANAYTAIAFDGSAIDFSSRAASKDYNFVAGEAYEVSKFKVHTPHDSSIIIRGFTLKNTLTTNALDMRRFFDKAQVTVAGEKVAGLNAKVNKDNELVLSFNDVKVAPKSRAEVVVKVALSDEFDAFGNAVKYNLSDFVAVDGKVASRVKLGTYPAATDLQTYTFAGSKIKLINVKLGNVDAAQNSEDIKIGEGTITVAEAVKGSFYVDVKGEAAGALKELTFVANGIETDAAPYDITTTVNKDADATTKAFVYGDIVKNTTNNKHYRVISATTITGDVMSTAVAKFEEVTKPAVPTAATDLVRFYFNNVEIERSGKVQFLVDINDATTWDKKSVAFSLVNRDSFTLKYDESGKPVEKTEVSGSLSLSKLTIQPAKASLTNKITKDVEFATEMSDTKVVFEGTYTAKNGDVKLNEFNLKSSTNPGANKVTFYLYVKNMDSYVADARVALKGANYVAADTFDNVLVKAGESVPVKVVAEVEAYAVQSLDKYELEIKGEDSNSNPNSGLGKAKTVTMKVVEKGSVNVSSPSTKQTLLRKTSDARVAEFLVKPANGAASVNLEEIKFDLTAAPVIAGLNADSITLKVGGIEEDCAFAAPKTFTCSMSRDVSASGVDVVVSLDDEYAGTLTLDNLKINGKSQARTFKKYYVGAAVWVMSQVAANGDTKYTLGVNKDSDIDVKDFSVTYKNKENAPTTKTLNKIFDDKDTLSVQGEADYQATITEVSYKYTSGNTWTAATNTCSDATHSGVGNQEKCLWTTVTVVNDSTLVAGAKVYLPDYFKIGTNEETLKVFKL